MTVFAAFLLAAVSPSTPAQDVAFVAGVCLNVSSGASAIPEPMRASYANDWKKLGLESGIDRATLNDLGPAVELVSQAAMGHRDNGDHRIVFASGGSQPGCRAILVGPAITGAVDAVAKELSSKNGGWREFPEMEGAAGPINKRVFLRRVDGKPYLLNLIELSRPIGQVHLFTTVVAIPAQVALPQGF